MMRIFLVILVVGSLFLGGCGSSPRYEFVEACYAYAHSVTLQHIKYIANDKILPAVDRKERIATSENFFKMVEEEYLRQKAKKDEPQS